MTIASEDGLEKILIDRGPVCFWAMDRELRVCWSSGSRIGPIGHIERDLRGLPLEQVAPPGSEDIWSARAREALEGTMATLVEERGDRQYTVTFFPLPGRDGASTPAVGAAVHDATLTSISVEKLRGKALAIVQRNEADRDRLSRFLHDDVCQAMSAAGLHLDLLRMDIDPALAERVSGIQDLLDSVMKKVRDFSYEIHPAIAERAGLRAALDRIVGRTRERFDGGIRLMIDSALHVPSEVAGAFCRIADQAIENAVEHSGCTSIEVFAKNTKTGAAIEIADNGAGFHTADILTSRRGLGLLYMEQLARQAGLHLAITSAPGQGTVVKALYPKGPDITQE